MFPPWSWAECRKRFSMSSGPTNALELCISQAILDEVAEVLARKFDWTESDLKAFLPPLWRRCTVVTPTVAVRVCDDPDDNLHRNR
jgi:predicted nucleic acid-binding protein